MFRYRCPSLRMNYYVVAAWLAVAVVSTAPPAFGQAPRDLTATPAGRRAPIDFAALMPVRGAEELRRVGKTAAVQQGPTVYYVANLEFADAESCGKLNTEDVHVFNRFQRFADAFIDARQLRAAMERLEDVEGLRWVELAGYIEAPPPRPPLGPEEQPRNVPEEVIRGGFDGLSGKGVTLAIVDTGLDFHHPDFVKLDADGQPVSRLLSFWDMLSDAHANGVGKPGPIAYPNGSPVGTVYSREDLTAELRGGRRIQVWDTDGHGTACAGIAAGNGRGSEGKHVGVAPQVDLIAVRLGGGLQASPLLNAICAWLDEGAADRPLVISCSFGGQYGGRDGHLVDERQLAARFDAGRRARAVCIAGGNEGADPLHAALSIGDEAAPGIVRWKSREGAAIEVYVQHDSVEPIRFDSEGDADFRIKSSFVHGLTGQIVINIESRGGTGLVRFFSATERPLKADAYISGNTAQFLAPGVRSERQIATPGTCAAAITVGSYDFNDRFERFGHQYVQTFRGSPLEIGSLSVYSNPGPARIGNQVKPEIVAPGQFFSAPAAANTYAQRDTTGLYQLFNGTSAATPYTAGVIALFLERHPSATLGEIKRRLAQAATHDQFTGEVPNSRWGHGKLDKDAIERFLARE